MKRILAVGTMLFVFTIGSAFAADQQRDQKRTRDQKKDGSCETSYIMKSDSDNILLAAQNRKRNGNGGGSGDQLRKRDGSCES